MFARQRCVHSFGELARVLWKLSPFLLFSPELNRGITDNHLEQAERFASDHPVLTGVAIGGTLIAVAPQVLTVPVLNAAGFGAQGVVGSVYQISPAP